VKPSVSVKPPHELRTSPSLFNASHLGTGRINNPARSFLFVRYTKVEDS
jgi:hypothetical protein